MTIGIFYEKRERAEVGVEVSGDLPPDVQLTIEITAEQAAMLERLGIDRTEITECAIHYGLQRRKAEPPSPKPLSSDDGGWSGWPGP